MWSVPSFLSWPFSLPSLPSISLPANIQRRFLSYVLQRTLGRYVRAGGLDVERIQAQISEGWVEIEGLEVNTEVSGIHTCLSCRSAAQTIDRSLMISS
jgi:autophagy-related protein 2